MNSIDFQTTFKKQTCFSPHPWQEALGRDAEIHNRLIRIPTAMGKTEGVLAAWAFNRCRRADDQCPRRLVWCLPMRVLVEQTMNIALTILRRMSKRIQSGGATLMGGEDTEEWFLQPEKPWILIGTQNMLLSRVINRGCLISELAPWPNLVQRFGQCAWYGEGEGDG